VQVRATKQIRATNTKMLCWQNIPAGHSPTPPLSSLIRRFSRVSWITIKSHHRPPGLWAHPALSTVARGYRHIRTSWGYRHIQACTSSSPGAIGTSRLVQAIGTAPHHPLTIDRGYRHIRSSTIAATWDHFIQEHASSEIARLKALLDQRTIPLTTSSPDG